MDLCQVVAVNAGLGACALRGAWREAPEPREFVEGEPATCASKNGALHDFAALRGDLVLHDQRLRERCLSAFLSLGRRVLS